MRPGGCRNISPSQKCSWYAVNQQVDYGYDYRQYGNHASDLQEDEPEMAPIRAHGEAPVAPAILGYLSNFRFPVTVDILPASPSQDQERPRNEKQIRRNRRVIPHSPLLSPFALRLPIDPRSAGYSCFWQRLSYLVEPGAGNL